MIEIRWHGRGGQGAKTAATLLAAAALHEGKHSQGFPEYGPERMGAPIRGFTRIADKPILVHCNIANPQIVVVLDPTLIGTIDVTEGMTEDGRANVEMSITKPLLRLRSILTAKSEGQLDSMLMSLEEDLKFSRNILSIQLNKSLTQVRRVIENYKTKIRNREE